MTSDLILRITPEQEACHVELRLLHLENVGILPPQSRASEVACPALATPVSIPGRP